jgi:hypothetical protein
MLDHTQDEATTVMMMGQLCVGILFHNIYNKKKLFLNKKQESFTMHPKMCHPPMPSQWRFLQ